MATRGGFEWDDAKAASNEAKHGVSFNDAVRIFLDPDRLERDDDRRDYLERRIIAYGLVGETHLCVIYTVRGHVARIISARPASRGERRKYERALKGGESTMAIVRKTMAELKAGPRGLSPETRARLLALTDEEIERVAESDPDNPLLTEEDFARMLAARRVRRARERVCLTREAFAREFHMNPARLAEIEDGVILPDETFLAYLTVIEKEPEVVRRALARDAG